MGLGRARSRLGDRIRHILEPSNSRYNNMVMGADYHRVLCLILSRVYRMLSKCLPRCQHKVCMLVVRGRLEVNSMAIVALEAGKLQLYHRVMVLDTVEAVVEDIHRVWADPGDTVIQGL